MKKVCFKAMILSLLVSACSLFNLANASLMLNIDSTSGKLLGASNININGEFYDVSFVDGICTALFSGCDEQSDFFWKSSEESKVASQALLGNVFVNSANGLFDSSPELTFGCSSNRFNDCFVLTPYLSVPVSNELYGFAAWNLAGATADRTTFLTTGIGSDTGRVGAEFLTYAVWSRSQAAQVVTEPSTLTVFALGLIGLVFRRCKKQS